MAEHTKGPWTTVRIDTDTWDIDGPPGEGEVGIFQGPMLHPDVAPANVRLIAAAPELLLTLQSILIAAEVANTDLQGDDFEPVYQDEWFTVGMVRCIKEAVARATGEAPQ